MSMRDMLRFVASRFYVGKLIERGSFICFISVRFEGLGEDTHATIEMHTGNIMRESPSFRPYTLYVHVPSISIRHNCMSENGFRVGSRAGR